MPQSLQDRDDAYHDYFEERKIFVMFRKQCFFDVGKFNEDSYEMTLLLLNL
jgi:hypothetical protein